MQIPSIKRARNLKNKTVLLRVDCNVPLLRGKILDDTRIRASLPTIQYLTEKGAKVVVLAHLGRPNGKVVRKLRLDPVIKHYKTLLKKDIQKIYSGNFRFSKRKLRAIHTYIQKMKAGSVVFFDNIRFSPDEKNNTGLLAETLASFGDIFVLDGFAVAHRASASVSGVPLFLKSYAGTLLQQEIRELNTLLTKPNQPFVAILGGAKAETKIPIIASLLPKAKHILIGGGVANTYFSACGYKIGDSIISKVVKKEAKLYGKKQKVITPIDVIVGTKNGSHYRIVDIKKTPHTVCKKGEAIYDIGPQTVLLYARYIKQAKTLLWNGAMGYIEQEPYTMGTDAIARLVGSRSKGRARGIIGGGETIASMEYVGMTDMVDYISTGGGAMLEFLSDKTLPGIKAIMQSAHKK